MAFSNFGTLVAKYNSSLPTITDGDYVVLQTDVNGRILTRIDVALPTGSNAIGSITNLFALDATLAKLTIAQGTALGANTQALVGGSVTTSAPTYTTGQISPLSLDTTGSLRVVLPGGSNSVTTFGTQTTTTGTITTSSSAVTASSVSPYSSFLVTASGTYAGVNFGFFASDDAGTTYYPIQAVRLDSFTAETTTGVLPSNQSRAWIVSVGGATNFKILSSAYTSGTANIRITPTATPIDQAVTVGGTVSAAQSGTWNITNVSGTVSLPTGAATEATLAKLPLAIASTTSGQFGSLSQGAVTTAAPTYTTAQTDPLSLKTTGSLRTEMSEWIGSTAPTVGSKTSANSIPVVVASDQGAITVADNQTIADNAGFTDGTSKVFTAGFIFDEVAGTALTENDAAAGRIDSKRAVVFALEDATTRGQRAAVSAGGALSVSAAQSGTWNITNVSGTVSLPTGAATEATLAKLPVAQSAALGANSGPMIQGSVTTAAPSYTTGNINPISLTTAGAVRDDVNSIAGTTVLTGNGATGAGSIRVTIANDNSAVAVNATQTGTWNIGSIGGAITPGTAAGNLGKAEDAAHASGDTGVFSLAVRNDTVSALATTNGDYIPFTTDSLGRLWVNDSGVPNPVFEAGTDADTYSDSGSSGDGTITISGSMTDVSILAVGAGTTAYICGLDFSCDKNAAMELVVLDGATLVETIRTGLVTPAHPTLVFTFPRAISVVGAATRNVKIRAKSLNGASTEAGGGINAYTR